MPGRKKKSFQLNLTVKYFFTAFCSLLVISYLIFLYFPFYLLAPNHSTPETKRNIEVIAPDEVKALHPSSSASASYRIPIVMYHYVEYVRDKKDYTRQLLDTEPKVFEAQIRTMVDANFTFLKMNEVADILEGTRRLPEKPVAITFDDGYKDFFTDAYPILKKYKVKATAYVVPGFFDKPNYMSAAQILTLSKDKNIELGAHTMHHVWLKDMPLSLKEREIVESKYKLEDLIHKPVVSFAYPYGAFDNLAIDLVKNAGFRTAVSTIPGIDESWANRYFLFRLRTGVMTGSTLLNYLRNPPYSK